MRCSTSRRLSCSIGRGSQPPPCIWSFRERPPIRHFTLDALCEMFGVIPHDRHTASGDAFITAQVFLRLRRLALRYGRERLGPISEPFQPEARPE